MSAAAASASSIMPKAIYNIVTSLAYTDLLMIGGITAIAIYLLRSRKTTPPQLVNLKALKVLPSK